LSFRNQFFPFLGKGSVKRQEEAITFDSPGSLVRWKREG
jgi:hypothetical protein